MPKTWIDIAIALISGLVIAVLLIITLNKHINETPSSINNNFYQFAILNVSSIKQDKANWHSEMSFAPELAAQKVIDNNKLITAFDIFVLFIVWILWLFFNKSVKRLIDHLY